MIAQGVAISTGALLKMVWTNGGAELVVRKKKATIKVLYRFVAPHLQGKKSKE